jgi:hypothetical protein
MISRRTTLLLADLFACAFETWHRNGFTGETYYTMEFAKVYDFLFQNDYDAWFCNAARNAANQCTSATRPFKDFILKIHTGESLAPTTPDRTSAQRERLGQELLRDLAEDIAKWWKGAGDAGSHVREDLTKFFQTLELDGYAFHGDTLLAPEEDVLDAKEQSGVLQDLYKELQLQNEDTVLHHLALSEEHYMAKRWDDSISNSRKFLEGVLQEVAASHHLACHRSEISKETYSQPASVRDYMESSGLLGAREKKALASTYGLLSETGGHPYMAESDQARLLRHLALTFSQFALLRLKGFKTSRPGIAGTK